MLEAQEFEGILPLLTALSKGPLEAKHWKDLHSALLKNDANRPCQIGPDLTLSDLTSFGLPQVVNAVTRVSKQAAQERLITRRIAKIKDQLQARTLKITSASRNLRILSNIEEEQSFLEDSRLALCLLSHPQNDEINEVWKSLTFIEQANRILGIWKEVQSRICALHRV